MNIMDLWLSWQSDNLRLKGHAALVPDAITAEREREGGRGGWKGVLAEESRPASSSRG
jgi:hypothetical protein